MRNINKFNKNWTKQIIESSHIAILVVDKYRKNLFVNPYLCELFGYSESELLEQSTEIFHPSKEAYIQFGKDVFNHVIEGEPVKMDAPFKKKDGTLFWGHISGDFIQNKEEVLWILIDIDERKKLEFKNAQQAEILSQIHDGIVTTDLNSIITSFNHGAEIVTGYKAEEVMGKNIELFYDKNDVCFRQENREKIFKEGVLHQELRFIKKDGTYIHTDLTATPLKDSQGNIVGIISYVQDITEKKLAYEKIAYQSYHDALTGLPNRALLNDRLEHGIKKAKHNGSMMALLFIDLDHFKEINDSLGHEVGDEVLKVIAEKLSRIIRYEDSLARLGGDEFGIILEELSTPKEATKFAQQILDIFNESLEVASCKLFVSCSIGIALYPNDTIDVGDLLKFADSALYKAKKEGRNNFQFYSAEMTEMALEHVTLEVELREALTREELVVYYQPQVDAKEHKIVGMEALVRWQHPKLGLVAPAKFIPLAESTGFIGKIDNYVMQKAMEQFHLWYEKGLNPGRLSLNLSAKQLHEKEFVSRLKRLITQEKCEQTHIELEVTESQIMANIEESIVILKKINALNINIAIDDFGTGYSSLSYLKKLPINKLKIDKSFVDNLPEDEDDATITRTIIALAKSLNLEIIAEGVEREEQKEFIVSNGCDKIQGYFYSKPLPADEMEEYLQTF